MPSPYTPEFKAAVLQSLRDNRFDIALTSQQSTVPERTLREWRRQEFLAASAKLPPHPSPAAAATPEFEDDSQALHFVRQQIIREIVDMAASLKDTLDTTGPYQRILALSHLLDRLVKLDAYLPSTAREQIIRIQYQYPDGTIHNVPTWVTKENQTPKAGDGQRRGLWEKLFDSADEEE